jgi:REP element-mobilizing transposase RayT
MSLNAYGQVTTTCWRDLPKHYPHIELDIFSIMPNHMHGIVIINNVGAGFKPALIDSNKTYQTAEIRAGYKPAPTLKQHGLPEIIRAFKTFSSRQINQIRNSSGIPVWQRNYYEHIIRSEPEMHKIREYIVNNPLNWETDENFKN